MDEEDVYEPLSNWCEKTFQVGWKENTHQKFWLVIHDDPEREKAEADICFGLKKSKKHELTDIIHVKTKGNLKRQNDIWYLQSKAQDTLNASPRVWVAIEKASYSLIKDNLDKKIGIIVYDEVRGTATNFAIKRHAIDNTAPKFLKETNKFINEQLGKDNHTTPKFFVCSLTEESWNICVRDMLWAVHDNNPGAIGVIQRVKPGDFLLFRLRGNAEYVAAWITTDIARQFDPDDNDNWKAQDPKHRNFIWRLRMSPLLVTRFDNAVNLDYESHKNEETGLIMKAYMSGMLEIKRSVYDTIFQKLVAQNLDQLRGN